MEPFRSEEFDNIVREAARVIAKRPGEMEVMRAICRSCMQVRAKGLICEMHRAISPGLVDCDFCLHLDCNI